MKRHLCLALAAVLLAVLPATAEDDLRALAAAGDAAGVAALLGAGTPVDDGDRYGATALLFAAMNGHLEVVELLLAKGADPDVEESFYHRTPLDSAIGGNHVDVVLRLVAAGVVTENPWTLLAAARQKQADVLRALAEKRPFYDFEVAGMRAAAEEAEAQEIVDLLKDIPATSELRPIQLTADELARFTGSYSGEQGEAVRTVEVAVRPGGLVAHEEGKDDVRLVAISPTHFRALPPADAGVLFYGRSTSVERSFWIEGVKLVVLRPLDPDAADTVTAREAAVEKEIQAGPRQAGPRQAAVNWGGFRGPGGSGVADGQGAPTSWDVETGKNVLWKTPIPGLANSSPVVWGDRIYVTTAVSAAGDRSIVSGLNGDVATTGDLSQHTWLVYALDKASGKVVWERTAGQAIPQTDRHAKATQANSTPVTDGEHVVAVFPTVGMFCYGADGELKWKKELGRLNASWFSDETVEWGFASSPILYDGKVILQADVAEGPYVAAWDVATGKEVWRTDRAGEIPTWTTPAIYRGERDELIANGTTIRGYDPKTGEELWKLAPNSEVIIAMPVVGDGLIYVGASYPPVRPLYAVRPGASGDISLQDGDESNGSIPWRLERGGSYMPTPIVYGELLYVGHHQGRLITYEAASGEQVYRARFSKKGTLTGSPVASDGRLYFAMEEGLIYVVRAGREYAELAVNDMKEIVMTTPAISDGALFLRTRTDLYALGGDGGALGD